MSSYFNDHIINQLGSSPAFSDFLQKNATSVQQVLRNTILGMYEEYSRTALDQGPVSGTVAEPAEVFPKPDRVSSECLQKRRLDLYQLPPADLSRYTGTAVILASAVPGKSMKACKDLLASADIEVLECRLDTEDPDNTRQVITELIKDVKAEVRGCIYFASGNTEGIMHADTGAVFNGRLLQMKHILGCAQALYPHMINGSDPVPFFGAVTFNGLSEGHNDPFMAAVHSQLNTLPLEYRKNAIVKGVDFYSEEWVSPESLLAELTVQDDYWSVRYDEGRRSVNEWMYEDIGGYETDAALNITPDTVILGIGGGTGITAECIREVAENSPCRIVLAGRTGIEIEPAFSHLVELGITGAELKKGIIDAADKADMEMLPAECDDCCRKIIRTRTIRQTVADLEKTGSEVTYVSCDVTVPQSVETFFEMIKFRYGRLDLIVYGAGVDRSQSLLNKDMESFEQVLRPKMLGIMNVLSNITLFPDMKKLILFSSFYAWQGMQGSMDYTAGNRFLGECASCIPKGMNSLSATALYWGPWKSEGMAGSKYLEEYFSSYGINMIDPEEGRDIFMRALFSDIEHIAAVPVTGRYNHAELKGLLKTRDVFEANRILQKNKNIYPFLDRIIEYVPGKSIKAVKKVSLDNDLYLRDHVFDGIPIVPGVIGTEIMAEAAKFLMPGTYIIRADNVRFNRPFQIKKRMPIYIVASAEKDKGTDEEAWFRIELSEYMVDTAGKLVSIDNTKFEAVMHMGSRHKLNTNCPSKRVKEVSGLHIYMPIEYAYNISEYVNYHLGTIMVGNIEGILADAACCFSENYHNTRPLANVNNDITCVVNPFPMDICMQNQIKCFFWGYMFRVLPVQATLQWTDAAIGMKTFSVKTRVSSFDMNRGIAILEGEVYDSNGNCAISLSVETYIRDYIDKNQTLFDCMTSQEGYGSLDVFFEGTEIALFAVGDSVLDKLEELGFDLKAEEYTSLPHRQARLDWAASRLALEALKKKIAERQNIPVSDLVCEKTSDNRFVVKQTDEVLEGIHISLSHASGWGFAGASFANERIGVDIETMESRDSSFIDQVLNNGENRLIEAYTKQVPVSKEDVCTIIYSCREALFKALNTNIGMNDIVLQHIDMSGKAVFRILSHPEKEYTVYYYILDKKVMSVYKGDP